jgi:hypothetical protein
MLMGAASILGLLDQPIKDLANLLGTLLWDSLLVILIVDKSHTEACLVTLSPLEVAVKKQVSQTLYQNHQGNKV